MGGGAPGAKFANLCSVLSITHLPLPESERPREQLGLRLGQLVTPRVGRKGQALEGGQDLWSPQLPFTGFVITPLEASISCSRK